MKQDLEKKLFEARQMLRIQGSTGNWDYDPYMQGMYNGMEYILALLEEREPEFKSAPKAWLKDLKPKITGELTVANLVATANNSVDEGSAG